MSNNDILRNKAGQPVFPGIAQSIGIAAALIACAFIVVFALTLTGNNLQSNEVLMLAYYMISFCLPCAVLVYIRKSKTGQSLEYGKIASPRTTVNLAVTTIILLFGVGTPLSGLIPMSDAIKAMFKGLMEMNGIPTFILMVIAAPIVEEILFRGIILDGLLKRHSPAKAIVVSSLLFGIVHMNPWQFVVAFLFGLLAGWTYYRTSSLVTTMIMHACANLTAFIIRISFDATVLIGWQPDNLIVFLACSVIVVTILAFLLNKELPRKEPVLADPIV